MHSARRPKDEPVAIEDAEEKAERRRQEQEQRAQQQREREETERAKRKKVGSAPVMKSEDALELQQFLRSQATLAQQKECKTSAAMGGRGRGEGGSSSLMVLCLQTLLVCARASCRTPSRTSPT